MFGRRLRVSGIVSFSLGLGPLWVCRVQASTVKLTGRIRALDGAALAGDVQVISAARYVQARSYLTDQEGRFAIEAPAEPRLLVVAKADGYISAERVVTMTEAGPEIQLDFRLYPAGTVSGRVSDDSGRPIAGAWVRVSYPGQVRRLVFEQETGNVRSDDYGHFRLPLVARGRVL